MPPTLLFDVPVTMIGASNACEPVDCAKAGVTNAADTAKTLAETAS